MPKTARTPVAQEDTQVSDATLRRNIGYNMKRAFNVVKADLVTTLKPYDLRMLTYSALVLIVDNPGLRQTQLAKSMDIEQPNLVKVLDQLESRTLIIRAPVQSDRRAYALHASKAGIALCKRANAAVERHETTIFAGLDKKQRALLIAAMQLVYRHDGKVEQM